MGSLPLPVSSVWKLACGRRLKYFLSIHHDLVTSLIPPFIFHISIPASHSSLHFSASPCHHICPPPTSPLFHHHPPLFWFIFTSHHSPLSPLPSLLPTASQMDRKGVRPNTPANHRHLPQGAASLHYGYIRMNVCC